LAQAQAKTVQQSRRKPLVLYVEDDDQIAQMYGLALTGEYEVERVRSGAEALKWLWRASGDLPNLVILDYTLPDMSGVEVLGEIRRHDRFDHIFAVMLSNHNDPDAKEVAFRLGALQWILKATTGPSQVARRLREELDRRGKVG
jgi:DNA-binding response OmpR family regulator